MSPRRIAKLLAGVGAVALVLLLAVTIVVVRHRSAGSKLALATAVLPGTLLHAHNFHWTQIKGDQSKWILKAKDATYSEDKTAIVLVDPQLSMVAQDGKQVELTADLAKLKLSGNHISQANLSGNLVMHYGDFVLTTDEASFTPDGDRLDANGAVKIESPDLIVTGVGLNGQPNKELFELHSQVITVIKQRQKIDKTKVS